VLGRRHEHHRKFAEAHGLHTKLDECGKRIIPDKQRQIYEYSDSELGVRFMMPKTAEEPWCPKLWGLVAGACNQPNVPSIPFSFELHPSHLKRKR
jgi:hypothetical protein